MASKYEQGKIYKICDNAYTKIYYGSTIETLSRRMCHHRSKYKIYKNGGTLYMSVYSIFDEYGLDNCKIELVEEYPCKSKMELCRKEGEYIQANVCVNKIIAGRTVSEKDKAYYEANKDKIRARHKALFTCELCGGQCQAQHKVRHYSSAMHQKALNNTVIDPIVAKKQLQRLEQNKIYYKAHKDEIRARNAKTFVCEICGGECRVDRKLRHCRSIMHQKALCATATVENDDDT